MKRKKDENIIKLLFDRDESALSLIQELYGNLVKSLAFNVLRNDSTAQECLNDTLLAIWDTIPPEKPDSVSAYAAAIVRRKAIDRLRRETAQKRQIHGNYTYDEISEELAFIDDFSADSVKSIVLSEVMNSFLSELSKTNREIFMCRYFDMETLDSISARMHISKNSLNAKLFRMRDKLKTMLEKEGIVQ